MNAHSCMMAVITLVGSCIAAAGLSGCDRINDDAKLVLTGSSTVAPLVAEIAKQFESLNPGSRIDVQTGGSSRGIADTRSGIANIGMVSRALNGKENDLVGTSIARDGIAIILHKDNPVSRLSHQEVVRIYNGMVTNWKDVGGHDAPISVINKADGRSTLELFLKYYKLNAKDIKASVIIGDNEQGIKTLKGNPNAIAYVSIGAAEFNLESDVAIKILPTDGISATTVNVANGTFPLSRPLTLVTKTQPKGLAKEFIEFARSPAVHDIIKQLYFVPIQ